MKSIRNYLSKIKHFLDSQMQLSKLVPKPSNFPYFLFSKNRVIDL